MALDVKKHTTIAAGEQPTRAGIAAMVLSVNDVIPVATTTARTQLVSDLTTASIPPATTRPLAVARADAPGLHRLELSLDGTVFIPASGVLEFADVAAAAAWATTNGALLRVGDRCIIGGVDYRWTGTVWVRPYNSGTLTVVGDSNGYLEITHGLNKIPVGGGAEICDDTPTVGGELKINGGITQADATKFKVRVYRFGSPSAGVWNVFGSNGVKISWWAFS
jgi:hypothetical protein